MAGNIKGITVEIGGDVTGLNKALKTANTTINATQKELKEVTRLLKLDPKNTTLLAQKQELLSKALQDNKDKLAALQAAKIKADQDMAGGTEINQEQYRKLCREIEATTLQVQNLEKEAKQGSFSMESLAAGADKVAAGANKVADATKAVSAAAAGLLVTSGKFAADFEDAFAKVSTLLDDSATDYEAYKNDIVQASNETGVAITEYSEAVYSAISAGVDQADAVKFTTQAVKLAKGGFTDTTKAVDVMTTALNGYSDATLTAEKVSDYLITTQNLGKTTVDELASSMGKVIPVAAAANYSMAELSTAYAALTRNGVATAEAGTYTKAFLNELTKAGSVTDQTLRELTGKGFAALKAEGASTTDILKMLAEAAEKDGKTLKDMFSSVEAGSAAMVLAKADGAEYDDILRQMAQSAGATESAFTKVTTTTTQQLAKTLNELKNVSIELGGTLLPIVKDVVAAFKEFVEKLKSLDENQLKMLATILAVVAAISPVAKIVAGISKVVSIAAGVFSTISGALAIFSGAAATGTAASTALAGALTFLAANPIVLIIAAIVAAIAALVAGFVYLWNNCEPFKQFWIDLCENIKQAVAAAAEWIQNAFTAVCNFFTVTVPAAIMAVQAWFVNLGQTLVEFFTVTIPQFVQGVIAWFVQLPNNIAYFIGQIIGHIILLGMKLVEFFTVTVPQFFNGVVAWFAQLPGAIWTWLCNAILFLQQWGAQLIQTGIQAATTFLQNTVQFFSQLPGTVWTWLSSTISKAAQFATNLATKAAAAATGFKDRIVEGVSSIPEKMVEIGNNIVQGLWNGIQAGWSWLVDSVKGLANSLFQGVKDTLGIHSPSTLFEWIGKMLGLGAEKGFEEVNPFATIMGQVKGFARDMAASMPAIQNTVTSAAQAMNITVSGQRGEESRPPVTMHNTFYGYRESQGAVIAADLNRQLGLAY